MFITFIQRRPNVFDVGPALYKCYYNVLCLRGYDLQPKCAALLVTMACFVLFIVIEITVFGLILIIVYSIII